MTESVEAGELIQDSGGSNPPFGGAAKLEFNNQQKGINMHIQKHVGIRMFLRVALAALVLLGTSGEFRLQPFAHIA